MNGPDDLGRDGAAYEPTIKVDTPTDQVARDLPVTTSCGCSVSFIGLQEDQHQWLLSVEQRGFAGAVELIQYLIADEEVEPEPGLLRWFEFDEFVAMHSWQDPVAMYRFGELLSLAMRARDEQSKRAARQVAL